MSEHRCECGTPAVRKSFAKTVVCDRCYAIEKANRYENRTRRDFGISDIFILPARVNLK